MSERLKAWSIRRRIALRYISVAEIAGDAAMAIDKKTRLMGSSAMVKRSEVRLLLKEGLVEVESYESPWDAITLTAEGWAVRFGHLREEGDCGTLASLVAGLRAERCADCVQTVVEEVRGEGCVRGGPR